MDHVHDHSHQRAGILVNRVLLFGLFAYVWSVPAMLILFVASAIICKWAGDGFYKSHMDQLQREAMAAAAAHANGTCGCVEHANPQEGEGETDADEEGEA